MQPHPSTIPVSPWVEILKGAKINFPVLKGKPKMNNNQEKFTKADIDFLKDVMSELLSNGEAISDHLKNEGKFYKESDPFHSHLCYKDFTKIRAKIKKLAEIQRKIKRMR